MNKFVLSAGVIVGLAIVWISSNLFGPGWTLFALFWASGVALLQILVEPEHTQKVADMEMFIRDAGDVAEGLDIETIKANIHPLLYVLLAFTGWGLVAYLLYKMIKTFAHVDGVIAWQSRALHDRSDHVVYYELEPLHFDEGLDQRHNGTEGMNTLCIEADEPFVALVAFRNVLPKPFRWLTRRLFGADSVFWYYGCVSSSTPAQRGAGSTMHTALVNTFYGEDACRFELLVSVTGARLTTCSPPISKKDLLDGDGWFGPHDYQEHLGFYA